ncbi:MAG: carbohydrate transporter substrate-binding protein family, partial [Eubacterium sp.]|nr:carbohydrate transporter substrate-binding protein family [Eubacterium sp.]
MSIWYNYLQSFSYQGGVIIKRVLAYLLFCCILLFGCSSQVKSNSPTTLTLWHNYGGQMKNTMDVLIDEFNDTVGKEKGIIVNVTSISGSATLQEKLIMAANDEPNAPELPDITTLYPNTALMLADKGLLTDIDNLFTEEELSRYINRFVEEGRLLDGELFVFPTAKSTEVIFLNMTIYNKFIKDTDASYDDLETFEGIIETAEKYYKWTDSQTPDIKNDGKAFITYDSVFNVAQTGFKQLADSFIINEELNLTSPSFNRVWNLFYEPAVKGYVANYNGYGSDLMKTGNVAASIGSTAGILFYSPIVTYEDNFTEAVEYLILPYPTFEDGSKVAIQRGGGIGILKSNEAKENAAGEFLKWFTTPEQNLKFVSSTGYLPVTIDAFNAVMNDESIAKDDNIKKLINTAREMQEQYDFYVPPA